MSTGIEGAHILVSEDREGTGQQYFCAKAAFTVAALATSHFEKIFPHPVRLNTVILTAVNDGDEGYVVVGVPGTGIAIGSITADVTINDTVVAVAQSVIDNIKVGNYIVIADGTNSEEVQVVAVDDVALTITVIAGINDAYVATTPTTIGKVVYMADKTLEFAAGERNVFGAYSTGGPIIPANTPIRVYYKNTHATDAARVRTKMEIWY